MPKRPRKETVDAVAKWVSVAVTLFGFIWGVGSTLQTYAMNARAPFLDRQLKLYEEAIETAAILATSADADQLQKAEVRFWELYWGELAMVENGGVKSKVGGVEGA